MREVPKEPALRQFAETQIDLHPQPFIHTGHLWRGTLLGICNGNQVIDLVTMQ